MHTGVRKARPSALGSTGLTWEKPVEELCCAVVGGSLEGKGLRPVWIIQAGSYSRWKGGNDQVTEQLEPRGVGYKGDENTKEHGRWWRGVAWCDAGHPSSYRGFILTPSNGIRWRKCHLGAQSPSKMTDC